MKNAVDVLKFVWQQQHFRELYKSDVTSNDIQKVMQDILNMSETRAGTAYSAALVKCKKNVKDPRTHPRNQGRYIIPATPPQGAEGLEIKLSLEERDIGALESAYCTAGIPVADLAVRAAGSASRLLDGQSMAILA